MIRKAEIDDLESIRDIYNAAIPAGLATADTELQSAEARHRWFTQTDRSRYPVWVLEDAHQQVVGWLSLRPFYKRKAYDSLAEMSIYLHPDIQQKGMGYFLASRAVSEARELGFNNLLALIFDHNTASIQLFKKLGFANWGLFPHVAYMPQGVRSVRLMGLSLNDGENH